jgi:hypothetical protein
MARIGTGIEGVISITTFPYVKTFVCGKLFLSPSVIYKGPVCPTGNFMA